MPEYDHECYDCQYAWQDMYSIHKDPPTICPKCGGKARRVILGVPAVKVTLNAQEMKEYIKEERKKVKKEVSQNENLKANIMGEESYHNTQNNINKIGEDLKQMI